MTPELAPQQLRKTRPWEYAVRFLFGGTITLAAGLIAKQWGPGIAGLFLAFPAILPASITLVKRHDGRAQAIEDARGGRLGTIGLVAFAIVVATAAGHVASALVLGLAALAWAAIDLGLWLARFGRSAT
jgi:hypothetical protein